MKNSFRKRKFLSIGTVLIVILVVSCFGGYWWSQSQDDKTLVSSRPEEVCRRIPQKRIDSFGGFYVPCIVEIGLVGENEANDTTNSLQYLLSLIKSGGFDAAINTADEYTASLQAVGIYHLAVAPGQEDALIKYLNTRKRNSTTNMNAID